ncbi:hypothetical protein ACLB1T_13080 [Escherichia coli]
MLDTAVAGDVPGIDNIKYPLKLGQGPGLMLFEPANQKLVRRCKKLCRTYNNLPH